MNRTACYLTIFAILLGSGVASAKKTYKFDGVKLGDLFGPLLKRAPYNAPCDNDPIDKRRLRAMVYGALPCRGRSFPEQTTLIIYLKINKPTEGRYNQPIVGLAFLGGSYFRKRSNFPVHPGDPLSAAGRHLGKPLRKLELNRKRVQLTAHQFPGNVWIVARAGIVRGVVLARMPLVPRNEQWGVLLQMYGRYTVRPTSRPASRPTSRPGGLSGICLKLWNKARSCEKTSKIAKSLVDEGNLFKDKCRDEVRRGRTSTFSCLIRTACKKWQTTCFSGPKER